ncbi:carbohydrate esterase family 4 protein [Tilletiaria anomala UBC 951]|uniref:chitin deacetylase n=1 Tax=Tilletiaria anomala (strain ATCC 24038 / CBS 436.72 / UBC 951) TaxID=1037660 RepID=A0A066W7I6_TILAU|nr:carbohydrate esterase family 4 protein [Tilletiaria anomala UBC 951]KDN49902.1 carbohydrate esterase family 4 protein [Tilletiaria anomala UBC 951]
MVRIASGVAAIAALVCASSAAAADIKPTPSVMHLVKRQHHSSATTAAAGAGGGSGAAHAGASPGLANFSGSLPASVLSIVATISSGTASSFPTYTLPVTATPGQTNSYVSGSPPLPTANIVGSQYPTLDQTPPTNDPVVQEWLKKIDLSKAPQIPVNPAQLTCSNSSNPNVANAASNGWWTCGGHTRDTDVTTCQTKNTWGVSYDDGPSPYSPLLLDYFQKNNIKSTFFIVGSRAVSRPTMLQSEYWAGHQLSVHTWSHPYLTTLTNEQIVAELAWTMKAIKDIVGVTPNTMRPPYGDIDDRVRYICKAMGLTPIIWTTANGQTYDTNDWKIGAGIVSAANSAYTFEQIIKNAPSLDTGYIVLAHDLYQQSVELSTEVILPFVAQFQPQQSLVPIINCVGQPMNNAYIETNANNSASSPGHTLTGSTPTGTGYNPIPSSSTKNSGAASALVRSAQALVLGGVAAVGAVLVI